MNLPAGNSIDSVLTVVPLTLITFMTMPNKTIAFIPFLVRPPLTIPPCQEKNLTLAVPVRSQLGLKVCITSYTHAIFLLHCLSLANSPFVAPPPPPPDSRSPTPHPPEPAGQSSREHTDLQRHSTGNDHQLTHRSGWQSVLLEAGGLSAALSEESMRRLKYCLHWLQVRPVVSTHIPCIPIDPPPCGDSMRRHTSMPKS